MDKNLISTHWVPRVVQRIEPLVSMTITSYDKLAEYYESVETHYLRMKRFQFIFDQTNTLTRSIKDFILLKFIDYPANTINLLVDDYMLDNPEVEKIGSVRKIISRTLKRLNRVKLLNIQIIDDIGNKSMWKTQCFLALWSTNQHYNRVHEIYENYSKAVGLNTEPDLTEEELIEKKLHQKIINAKVNRKFKKFKLSNTEDLKEDHDLKVAENILSSEVVRTSKIAKRKVTDHRIKQTPRCSHTYCDEFIKTICKNCLKPFCYTHGLPEGRNGHVQCNQKLLTESDFELLETDTDSSFDQLLTGNTTLQLEGGSKFD